MAFQFGFSVIEDNMRQKPYHVMLFCVVLTFTLLIFAHAVVRPSSCPLKCTLVNKYAEDLSFQRLFFQNKLAFF